MLVSMFANIGVLSLIENPLSTIFTSSCYSRVFLHTQFKSLDNREKPLSITTGSSGTVWVYVGTDSGFESLSEFYYGRIHLVFTKVNL